MIRTMPWYMYPRLTCRVLNRIASRFEITTIDDLNRVLDSATTLLWSKQERYYRRCAQC